MKKKNYSEIQSVDPQIKRLFCSKEKLPKTVKQYIFQSVTPY